MKRKHKSVSYSKWGYIFILPFFVSFFIFSFIPLADTIRYSFFEYYRSGIKEIGPNFVGMENYSSLMASDMLKYAGNTFIPIIAAISIIVVFPNHIRKFINPTSDLVPNTDPIKSIGSLAMPIDIKMPLIGPFVENNVKNSIANADAIIRFGR